MARAFALAHADGASGQSTVALNLTVWFARGSHRTLAVDLDQQGDLFAALRTDLKESGLGAHRLLIDDEANIGSFLLQSRRRLLSNPIGVEAEDLLEARKNLGRTEPNTLPRWHD